jgi:hypothetical protein
MFGVLPYVYCILHRTSSNIYLFALRRTKRIKKDALYKTKYHSEKKVQNITLSLDVINQRVKYSFLSDCLWFNELNSVKCFMN